MNRGAAPRCRRPAPALARRICRGPCPGGVWSSPPGPLPPLNSRPEAPLQLYEPATEAAARLPWHEARTRGWLSRPATGRWPGRARGRAIEACRAQDQESLVSTGIVSTGIVSTGISISATCCAITLNFCFKGGLQRSPGSQAASVSWGGIRPILCALAFGLYKSPSHRARARRENIARDRGNLTPSPPRLAAARSSGIIETPHSVMAGSPLSAGV
jgi:hypothetical protein